MIKVKEGLTGKNAADKVKFGGNIKLKLTGNAFFTDATDLLTALNTATANLKTANDDGITAAINEKEVGFDNAVKAIVLYIQGKILGVANELAIEMVTSAGFEQRRQGSINIDEFKVEAGVAAQSVKLRRKVIDRNKNYAYIWMMCTGDISVESNWKYAKFSTLAKVLVTGLTSGIRYWFKVAVVEGETQMDFTEPQTIILT